MPKLTLTIGCGMEEALKECAERYGLTTETFVVGWVLGRYLEDAEYVQCSLCQRWLRDIDYVCPECEAVLATVKDADGVVRLVREYEERDMATGDHE